MRTAEDVVVLLRAGVFSNASFEYIYFVSLVFHVQIDVISCLIAPRKLFHKRERESALRLLEMNVSKQISSKSMIDISLVE